MGQVLQGGEQRPNRMAHLSSFAARRSSGSVVALEQTTLRRAVHARG
jgi:hypothetical protein